MCVVVFKPCNTCQKPTQQYPPVVVAFLFITITFSIYQEHFDSYTERG